MALLDVFNTDAFTLISLTDAINKIPYKPARLGEMGTFQSQGVATTSIVIEERDGILALLPTKLRGEAASQARRGKRRVRSFVVPHIPHEDAVLAQDVQNVRAFGSENTAEGAVQVVADRLAAMRQSHETTLEYHRVGAVHGKILDSDGSTVIYNLFTEFGVTEQTVDFVLGTNTTDVRAKCLAVLRLIEKSLGGNAIYDHVHAICGATWFEALIGHDYVRDAYHRWRDSENLRNDPRRGFEFGGIIFEEYRGLIGNVNFINASQARFFPVGAPNFFKTYHAPANFMETVNTIGIPLYAKQERMKFDRGINLLTESNPLCMCTAPRALIKGTTS